MDDIDYSETVRLVASWLPEGYEDISLAEAVIKVMALESLRDDMNVGIVLKGRTTLTTRKQIKAIFDRPDFPAGKERNR